MSRRARVWLLVPLGVLAVAAASCGGTSPTSSNGSTTTTSASSTSSTGVTTTSTTPSSSTSSTSFPPVTPTTPSGCVGVSANAGQSQGAAGTITGEIILSETQGATCSLGGYPTMALTTSSGASIPVVIVDGLTVSVGGAADQPASQVTLSPTQKLAFWYQYSDVPTGNGSCLTSAHATVTPPGGTRTTPPFTLMVMPCDNGQIRVSPLFAFS